MFLDIETTVKNDIVSSLEKLTQRHNGREQVRRFDLNEDDGENEKIASTQFLQIQKNQIIELKEYLERYCNVLPVFGFNSAKNHLMLIKSYLLPNPVDERDVEPTVIKQTNQFSSLKFGEIQLLDLLNFSGGETSLDSFLKSRLLFTTIKIPIC